MTPAELQKVALAAETAPYLTTVRLMPQGWRIVVEHGIGGERFTCSRMVDFLTADLSKTEILVREIENANEQVRRAVA